MDEGFALYLLTAIGLVFVLEGLLYALFPDFMRRMLATALSIPVSQLRTIGVSSIIAGILCLLVLSWVSAK